MISGATGDRIADYLIKNQGSLNVKYVIWKQRIWMPGQGWKGMERPRRQHDCQPSSTTCTPPSTEVGLSER